jgi:cellulose synthase/poly-beta-1,6-N-acetylglucosamine synthase-like glycosyltransferase
MEFITGLYLFVIIISIYLYSIFLLLLFKNRKELFNHNISKENLPTVSILIPAYNEEKTIAGTINSVLNLDYPKDKIEIIVLNDGSTDNTEKIAKSFKGIKVITKPNSGKADSLNYGINIAKNEFIAAVDADCYHEKDALLKVINCFKEDSNIEAVTSTVRVKNQETLLGKLQFIEYTLIAWARKLLEFINSVYVTPGPLSVYRKSTLEKLGGFDKNNMTEDIELAWRILRNNHKIKMCLSAKAYTIVPDKFKKWWHQRLRWDIGGLQTFSKHKDTLGKTKYGMLGIWVAPFYLSSFILALLGFLVAVYILGKRIISKLLLYFYSINTDSFTLEFKYLHLTPSIFTIFGLLLITIYLTYITFGLKMMDPGKIPTQRKFTLLIYMFFYLILYPLVFIQSLYLFFMNKSIKW